jgi:mono/diheme cytochrome c family protein
MTAGRAWAGVTVVVLCAAVAVAAVAVVHGRHLASTVAAADGQTIQLGASQTHGRPLFARYCSNCHALRASRAVARVGPSLDFLRPPAPLVRRTIRDGSSAVSATMPPQILTGQEADDVAAYVAAVAGR